MINNEFSNETEEIKFSVTSLFPIPLYSSKMSREFTGEELEFFNETYNNDLYKNTGNYTTNNKFILDTLPMKNIKEEIQIHLDQYLKHLESPTNDLELYITQSWINYTEKHQFHHKHNHFNSYLSGCLYISADSTLDSIVFHRQENQMNNLRIATKNPNFYNSESILYLVKTGDILIFPSFLAHSVLTTKSDKTRISLSFNTFLRGNLGDVSETTYLQLK